MAFSPPAAVAGRAETPFKIPAGLAVVAAPLPKTVASRVRAAVSRNIVFTTSSPPVSTSSLVIATSSSSFFVGPSSVLVRPNWGAGAGSPSATHPCNRAVGWVARRGNEIELRPVSETRVPAAISFEAALCAKDATKSPVAWVARLPAHAGVVVLAGFTLARFTTRRVTGSSP